MEAGISEDSFYALSFFLGSPASCKMGTIFTYIGINIHKLFELLAVVSIAFTKFVFVEVRHAGCME